MTKKAIARKTLALVWFTLAMGTTVSLSQSVILEPRNARTQADYVIICPSRYVSTVQPLATFRQSTNGFTVAVVTTEAIYNVFGQGIPPDSAIKSFIGFTLAGGWGNPPPQYFLLAGNVGAIPSHKEPGFNFPPIQEDSVHIDQWLVEAVPDTALPSPGAAIGRFPAQDSAALHAMVAKTISYETATDTSWFSRTLIVADSAIDVSYIFESDALMLQQSLAPVWRETTTVHVRESSPLHRTRQEFRSLWDQGAAIVGLLGFGNSVQFSQSAYFTAADVDSLSDGGPPAFCAIVPPQRFERTDTLSIAVRLLQAETKGAVAALAPCGLTFLGAQDDFFHQVFQAMVSNPDRPIGRVILDVKRTSPFTLTFRRQSLLGDPALLLRSSLVAGSIKPPPTLPARFLLHQNYPNPFNPSTTITFSLAHRSAVQLTVYDMLGREVETLVSAVLEAGEFSAHWAPTHAASGVYYYRLEACGITATRHMLLLK